MGGLDGAIDQAAEAALARLGKAEIVALPRLLRCLAVPVHDRKSATTGANDLTVRTVTRLEAAPDPATDRLVNAMIDARIIVTTGADGGSGADHAGLIGVSHQRVFESWERARAIVAEHKEFFRIRDEVEAQRRRWQEKGRPSALLLAKGVPLAEAQKIVKGYGEELNQDVRAYVATSNRRAQRLNIFMGATAAVFALLFVAATWLGLEANRAQKVATTSYEAAKGAVGDLVTVITDGLRDIEGIRVATVQNVLGIVDKTIQKVQSVRLDDSQLARIRAQMLFEGGKAYQKKESREEALKAALESLAIRAKLTAFELRASSPAVFHAAPGLWRWELSQSLEFVGDLHRQADNAQAARTHFDDTLAVRLRLVEENPDNEDWALGVSFVYTRLGDLDIKSKSRFGAEELPRLARDRGEILPPQERGSSLAAGAVVGFQQGRRRAGAQRRCQCPRRRPRGQASRIFGRARRLRQQPVPAPSNLRRGADQDGIHPRRHLHPRSGRRRPASARRRDGSGARLFRGAGDQAWSGQQRA